MLLRIGEFARRSGVSAKTLRFYDDAGLLRPAVVDSRTRYRYYLPHQLKDLASIRALRDVGISIADVRQLSRSHSERIAILKSAKAALEVVHLKTVGALTWLDSQLLEPDSLAPKTAVVLKNRPAMQIAAVSVEVSAYSEIAEFERNLRRSVPVALQAATQGVFWHNCGTGNILGEPFVELKRYTQSTRGFEVRDLPRIPVACAYTPMDDDLSTQNAYTDIRKWMNARGYAQAGALCEIYHDQVLEIQFPLHRA
jgi:DNA-binding transcriptional MerR regulator